MNILIRRAALSIWVFAQFAGQPAAASRAQEIAYVLNDQLVIGGIAISADSTSLAVLYMRQGIPPAVESFERASYVLPTGRVRLRTANSVSWLVGLAASPVDPIVAFIEQYNATQRRLAIWNVENDEVTYLDSSESGARHALLGVAFSTDGKLLACANSSAGTATIWDVASRKQGHILGALGKPSQVSFVADGDRLAVNVLRSTKRKSVQNEVQIWQLSPAKRLDRIRVEGTAYIKCSPKHNVLAFTANNTVSVRNLDSKQTRLLGTFGKQIVCLAFSPDGRYLAVGADGVDVGALRIFDLIGESAPFDLRQPDANAVIDAAFSPDGAHLAVVAIRFPTQTTNLGYQVVVWRLPASELLTPEQESTGTPVKR